MRIERSTLNMLGVEIGRCDILKEEKNFAKKSKTNKTNADTIPKKFKPKRKDSVDKNIWHFKIYPPHVNNRCKQGNFR